MSSDSCRARIELSSTMIWLSNERRAK